MKYIVLRRLSSLDIELFRDFVDNHYPEIKSVWDQVAKEGDNIDAKDYWLTKFIDQRLRNEFESSGIEYRKSKSDVSQGSSGIPIIEFSDALKNLIITKGYNDSELYLDHNSPRNYIYFVEAQVYYSADENCCLKILPILQNICKHIQNDIQNEIIEYNGINNRLDHSLKELSTKMNNWVRSYRVFS